MTLDHFLSIVFIQTALSAIVAITCFYRYKSRDRYVKLIGFAFLIGFLANVIAFAMRPLGLNPFINIPPSIYVVLNFTLITIIYFDLFKRRGFDWLLIVVPVWLFGITNVLFIQKLTINSYTHLTQSFVILIYTLIYFYRLMVELPARHIHHLPMFWINSGFLIFHAGTFFLFAFTTYLTNVLNDNLLIYWSFHNCLSIIEHIIVLIGLYYDLKGKEKLTTSA